MFDTGRRGLAPAGRTLSLRLARGSLTAQPLLSAPAPAAQYPVTQRGIFRLGPGRHRRPPRMGSRGDEIIDTTEPRTRCSPRRARSPARSTRPPRWRQRRTSRSGIAGAFSDLRIAARCVGRCSSALALARPAPNGPNALIGKPRTAGFCGHAPAMARIKSPRRREFPPPLDARPKQYASMAR